MVSDPSTVFADAVGICNMTSAQAGAYLGRSSLTIQAYVIGKRRPPEELTRKLLHLWQDAAFGESDTDRYGAPIPECVLAIRRLREHPAMTVTFDTLREAMARTPQPDPDATPFVAVGEIPDDDVADYDDKRHPSDGPPGEELGEDETEGETP